MATDSDMNAVAYAFSNIPANRWDEPITALLGRRRQVASLSTRDFHDRVFKLACALESHGLRPHDGLCIHTYNSVGTPMLCFLTSPADAQVQIWYPVVWMAVVAVGAYVSGANPNARENELVRHLRVTGSRFIVTDISTSRVGLDAARACEIPPECIFLVEPSEDVTLHNLRDLKSIIHHVSGQHRHRHPTWGGGDITATVMLTSGTTGLPKAALISHRALISQCQMIEDLVAKRTYQASQVMCLPVYHAFAAQLTFLPPPRIGLHTIFLPRFDKTHFLAAVERYAATDVAIVPHMIAEFLTLDHKERRRLCSLRYVVCAGTATSSILHQRLVNVLPQGAVVGQCYGLTETGWIAASSPHEQEISDSVGRLLSNVKLKIRDISSGRPLLEGGTREGEAWVATSSAFTAYSNDTMASHMMKDREGYIRTGDIVQFSGDKLYIRGRVKNTIKIRGCQVSPEEVEAVLIGHEAVRDAGVTDEVWTNAQGSEETRLRALVVRWPIDVFMLDDVSLGLVLCRLVERQLSTYKHLAGGVLFVGNLPGNEMGKLDRFELSQVSRDVPMDGRS